MEVWESNSEGRRQTIVSSVCLAAGLLLVAGLHDFGVSGSGRQAGFLLGLVLTLIGAATLAVSGRERVIVDPRSRCITVQTHRLIGHTRRSIRFDDISDVQVAFLQTRSHQVLQYFLQLQLRGGETIALFAPGRLYPGASDPALVAGWKTRLERYLQASGADPQSG